MKRSSRKYQQAWVLLFISCCAVSAEVAKPPHGDVVDVHPTLTISKFVPLAPVRMIAYGDMRFTDPSVTIGTNPRVRKYLAERVGMEHPDAMLLTGDMPYVGANDADWQVFREETASWRANSIPVWPTMGNHELKGGTTQGIANYLKNFPEIEGHRYYSVLMGSVEVISLDMTSPSGGTSPQATWFAAQLDHIPSQVEFLFILYHAPWVVDEQSQLFTNLPTKEALTLRHLLEIHLYKMHCRIMVLSGHLHTYERFERNGVEYVVSGGGGAEPYPVMIRGPSDLYQDNGFPVYHYLTLEYRDHAIHAVMWKVKDPNAANLSVEVKDKFTLLPVRTTAPATSEQKTAGAR